MSTLRHILGSILNAPLKLMGLRITRAGLPSSVKKSGPDVEVRIGSFLLTAPSSHRLPETYITNPDYSSQLGRIAKVVAGKYPEAFVIDIGANIGDTAAIVRNQVSMPLFCIEGDEACFPYLSRNLPQLGNARAVKTFLGEQEEEVKVVITNQGFNGTLTPSQAGDAKTIQLLTFDDVVAEHLESASIKLIKIDTEGFDTKILRGAKSVLAKHQPVVFFEYNRDNMTSIGEAGIGTLWMLRDLGYDIICFYDEKGRFLLQSHLGDESLITDLHEYADGFRAGIYYFDLCIFHKSDSDIASKLTSIEREFRLKNSGSPTKTV